MIPPPPRSTLFPYTTLFRSTGKPVISNHLGEEDRFRTPELLLEHGIHRAINVILQGDQEPFGVLEVDSRDRKSTRLNSSHPSISYAVFCLKKKKKQRTEI